jgi:hypothetical protein
MHSPLNVSIILYVCFYLTEILALLPTINLSEGFIMFYQLNEIYWKQEQF